jgi:hypothetical protein
MELTKIQSVHRYRFKDMFSQSPNRRTEIEYAILYASDDMLIHKNRIRTICQSLVFS